MNEYLIGIRIRFEQTGCDLDELASTFASELKSFLKAPEGARVDSFSDNFSFEVVSVNVAIPLSTKGL